MSDPDPATRAATAVRQRARRRAALTLAILAALALPWALDALGASFYISMAGRILVYAIAATCLNLVLGYGGMVSFGHAAFVGLGAYVTGVMVSDTTSDARMETMYATPSGVKSRPSMPPNANNGTNTRMMMAVA